MKVTRKLQDELPKIVKGKKDDEIAPSLYLRGLSEPIKGLEPGENFHGHVKGKCRHHAVDKKEDGSEHHTYDLDIHDFDHWGKGETKPHKKTSREEVEEAMDKYDNEKAKEKK